MHLLLRWIISALALLALPYVMESIRIDGFWTAVLAAAVLGLVNALVRPLLIVLTLPATILTLGLFIFVVNALSFWLASSLAPGFHVAGFWSAFLGAIVYSLVTWAASVLLLGK